MRLRAHLLVSAALVVAFSCGKSEPDPTPQPSPQPEPQPEQQITVPTESQTIFNSGIDFTAGSAGEGGSSGQAQTTTVKFTATASWSADVKDTKASSWLSVKPSSGNAGDVNMTVTAQPNTGTAARSATVTLKCGSNTKSFTVNQAGSPPAVISVESVTLNKTELSLEPGGTETLTATVKPDNATDKTVTWSTSNAEVATVTDGKVTAIKEGEATITAKAGEKSATCKVTVKMGVIPVESVTLDKTSITLEEDQGTLLTATVLPENATDKTVTWSTSNAEVATVNEGRVITIHEGEAIITAQAGDKSATCKVTVKKAVVAVSSITLNKVELSLTKGQSEVLVATVLPENATDKTVTWNTSDATVASVTQDGQVTALKSGKADITAKAGEKSATCAVTVTTPVESVSLDRASVSLEVGQSTTLVATISPNDADEQKVEWSTSDATIATVTNGVVTAVAEGNATITAKVGGKSATCAVSVKNSVVIVTSVTLNKSSLSLVKGQNERLTATVNPENATDKTVTWSSSDATIASITQDGQVTALKSGKAVITAKAGEKSATCEVTITTPVESVSLDRSSVSLEEGQTTTLIATISPNDADEKTVTWTTSNASVALVNDGVVKAVAEGQATITAKAGDKSATCIVSVKKAVVAVSTVTLNKTSMSLTKGQSEALTATVTPDDATDKTVTWSSSDATVASVSQNGLVTALKSGKAVITAKAGEKSATCEVTITTPVVSVTLDRSSISLEEAQTTTLIATISPNDADEKTVVWTTSNASVATVAGGVVTAVAEGNATITAKVGGKSATCAVSVKKTVVPVTSVTLNKSSLSLVKGQNEKLVATVNPDNATDKTVTWSSSDATTATVTQSGLVTALKSGKVTITAKAGEKSATCEVTVTTPVESVSLDYTSVSLEEGQSTTLIATINPNDADEKTVSWTTSNSSVATVSNGGLVTAIKEGTATITAKAGGKEATCAVSVTSNTVPVTSIEFSDDNPSGIRVGESVLWQVIIHPENATDKTVTWSVMMNPEVASVDQSGRITGLSEGTATIKAAAGGLWIARSIDVMPATPDIPVQSIWLNRDSATLVTGEEITLTATVIPDTATDKTVTWSSSAPGIASVDQTGKVTALSVGEATITAKAGGKEATCAVSVTSNTVPVTSIEFSDDNPYSVRVGESVLWTVIVLPENATDKTVTWSIYKNPEVASVDQSGRITGLSEGTAMIKAAAGDRWVARTIIVMPAIPEGNDIDDPDGFEDGGTEEW